MISKEIQNVLTNTCRKSLVLGCGFFNRSDGIRFHSLFEVVVTLGIRIGWEGKPIHNMKNIL